MNYMLKRHKISMFAFCDIVASWE